MKPDIPARDRTDQTRRRAVPAPRRKVGRSSVSPIFLAFITRQSTIPYSPSTVNTVACQPERQFHHLEAVHKGRINLHVSKIQQPFQKQLCLGYAL